ncbi:MAG: electron transporter RnfD [Deltaproteobacteria bacterium RIFOXYA12_FULL_61_11]|nr:MAG: electron transporter RnfD [Deltaproteobacteria bacterium RIFOXYA12_FULL_61_11]
MKSNYLSIVLRTSPHLSRGLSVETVMRQVIYALLPVTAMAIYTFGQSAALLLITTTLTCVLTEWIYTRLGRQEPTIGDWSAALTGLLLGLTLPPAFPLWMGVIGSIVSILVGKMIFGGLGCNIFNPALVGRAFLQASFPVAITTWSEAFAPDRFQYCASSTLAAPFLRPMVDAVSGATPLAAMKFSHQTTIVGDLFFGLTSGSTGETSAVLILLGGLYLAWRHLLDWRIPLAIMLSVALFSGIFWLAAPDRYPDPLFMLFSGGLMLGAVFMATDMVTSPLTPLGVWIYGGLIGLLVVVIRLLGGLPEGVMYAILLGNAFTPLISRMTGTKVYGTNRKLLSWK